MSGLPTPYPEIEPRESGMMKTADGHSIHWEASGNPNGAPVVFLHGGPGSGTSPWWRRLFDPDKYNIIMFDQRGAGKSTPHASLQNNTTQHLIEDIEQLRQQLDIKQWAVFGGSWGSTLALAYADAHPAAVNALVMYGIFLCRDSELRDLYYEGGLASKIFPDEFEPYISLLAPEKRANPIEGYRELFLSPDKEKAYEALDRWTRLEKRVTRLVVEEDVVKAALADPDYVLAHSLIENHYFINHGFIDGDALLKTIGAKLQGKPVHIIQGRYDMVCPFITAWELHKAVPGSTLHILPECGHSAQDPKMTAALIGVLDELNTQKPAPAKKPRNNPEI